MVKAKCSLCKSSASMMHESVTRLYRLLDRPAAQNTQILPFGTQRRIVRMSLYYACGSPEKEFTAAETKAALFSALEKLGVRRRVMAVPPDFTRAHSMAGQLTEYAWNYYGDALTD